MVESWFSHCPIGALMHQTNYLSFLNTLTKENWVWIVYVDCGIKSKEYYILT